MAEYLEPLITCDKILELFTPNRPAGFEHSDILRLLDIGRQTQEAGFVLSALSKLENDNHLERYGLSNHLFKITGTTFTFKSTGGYKGQIERENEIESAKTSSEKMVLKSAQSVIDTNLSIQNLNDNTHTFYKKQTKFNNWQKGLTIAIMLSTLAYTIISYFMLTNQNKQLEQEKIKSKSSIQEIKSQILQDSAFLDSLKNKLKK